MTVIQSEICETLVAAQNEAYLKTCEILRISGTICEYQLYSQNYVVSCTNKSFQYICQRTNDNFQHICRMFRSRSVA